MDFPQSVRSHIFNRVVEYVFYDNHIYLIFKLLYFGLTLQKSPLLKIRFHPFEPVIFHLDQASLQLKYEFLGKSLDFPTVTMP